MRRVFAAVLAIACVAGSTPVFARGFAHGAGAYARRDDVAARAKEPPFREGYTSLTAGRQVFAQARDQQTKP
jgi:hypothetical protein